MVAPVRLEHHETHYNFDELRWKRTVGEWICWRESTVDGADT